MVVKTQPAKRQYDNQRKIEIGCLWNSCAEPYRKSYVSGYHRKLYSQLPRPDSTHSCRWKHTALQSACEVYPLKMVRLTSFTRAVCYVFMLRVILKYSSLLATKKNQSSKGRDHSYPRSSSCRRGDRLRCRPHIRFFQRHIRPCYRFVRQGDHLSCYWYICDQVLEHNNESECVVL